MANIGPDGVLQIYPDGQGSQVYLKDNFDKNIFNVSFGGGSHLPFTQKKEGNLTYFSTTGSPISYNSGAAPGRSVRIDVYPGGGMWANKTSYSWKNNPGYLYNDKGIKNTEFTIIARPGKALGTQQSFCAKIGGRDEDALRSLIEMGYTDAKHSQVYANYNYAHFPYVHVPIKIYANPPKFTPGKWSGLKVIRIVSADNKSVHWEMWYNEDPVDASGNIQNTWKKAAEFEDKGVSQYGNVPCTWKCHKDLCRIDGFESVDFALVSDREIDPNGPITPNPIPSPKPVPNPSPSPSPQTTGGNIQDATSEIPAGAIPDIGAIIVGKDGKITTHPVDPKTVIPPQGQPTVVPNELQGNDGEDPTQ